ncbi:FAD-dependent oxidoreductase [soil metagenome]
MANVSVKYLLIGGGAAVAQAAVGIREVDKEGSAMIVCQEPRLPYDRVPLTKGFLKFKPNDPEDIESKDASFYPNNNIEVRIGTEATKIDRAAKTVELSDGTVVTYEKLLLATGATPKDPGIKGSDLANVTLFRTVDDGELVRTAANDAENVVLIGSGYIGMEIAASMTQRGKNVTVIARDSYPLSKSLSPISGSFVQAYFENNGIKFITNDEATEIAGDGKVQTVRTKNGHAPAADLVVIGAGVTLNTKLAKDADLPLDSAGAVKANRQFQTEDASIYVAGDIAAFEDATAETQRHIEHFMNAKWTGKAAGRNMAGANEDYDKVAYFFSDIFDLSFVLRGQGQAGRSAKVLGDVDTSEFVEVFADGSGTVVKALAFTTDAKKYDVINDALEAVILAKKKASELTLADVGLG